MLHRSREHVGDGLNSAMRVPRKSLQVIGWIVVAEIIQQQERIELLGLAEAEGAFELYARALNRRLGLNHFFYWSE